MITDPACPVCGGADGDVIGTQTFRRKQLSALSDYDALRLRVLFEVWLPGTQEARFGTVLCRACGFVFQTPRPTREDLDAKYRFLASCPAGQAPVEVWTGRRAERLLRKVRPYLRKREGARVLDFGGGDGRLMRAFLDSGFAADVVDYSDSTITGVRKIGDTEESIPENYTYDATVCSHVVEHIADPVQTLARLIKHLKTDGVIYVEVPMEVWAGPPRPLEPVTHINFFTLFSMRYMLRRAGAEVIQCGLDGQPHDSGRTQLVVTAIARRSRGSQQSETEAIDTPRYLAPSALMKLRRRVLMPSTIAGAVRHKLGWGRR